MTVAPRPEVAAIPPVPHGAIGDAELATLGLSGADVIDFSVNSNPLGASPAVRAAVAAALEVNAPTISRYPDATALPLRHTLAERLGVAPEMIVVGNGSSELIWLLALVYARPAPEAALIAAPTFGEYERACRLLGARLVPVAAGPDSGFRADPGRLAAEVQRHRPRLAWLGNPNNPTSTLLDHAAVAAVLDACATVGTLLVVDEAYLGFVDTPPTLLDLVASGHLFLLRSMTKDCALAGLRLGYGVAPAEMAALLRSAQPPWSVNTLAQAAGIAALGDPAHLERARVEVRSARALLVAGLQRLGFSVTPPTANFVLVDVSGGARFRSRLLAHGCVVRDCASFGLPRHVRIAVRSAAECRRLLAAIEDARLAAPGRERGE